MSDPFNSPDPKQQQESKRYSCPIVSRDHILECLRTKGKPLSHKRLCKAFGYTDESMSYALSKRLNAMVRDGQLYKDDEGHFAVIKENDLLPARVFAKREGAGFAEVVGQNIRVRIPMNLMARLFHGDEINIRRYRRQRHDAWSYSVIMPTAFTPRELVGRYTEYKGASYLMPIGRDASKRIRLIEPAELSYQEGDWLLIRVEGYEYAYQSLVGQVIRQQPPGQDWQAGITALLTNEGISEDWPEEVLAEVAELPDQPREEDYVGRSDLRDLAFVTIDGEDAKDFDDAIYAEHRRTGWRLWVAIADVSHYVRPGTKLDDLARSRSTSIYLPDRVVPMLPEALSNGLCSLRPEEDRLALVAVMDIAEDGSSRLVEFTKAVIRSHARLTYDEVQAMMQTQCDVPAWWSDSFQALQALGAVLAEARRRRHAIPFVTPEIRVRLADDNQIEGFDHYYTHDAHALIESCMLAANEHAARWCDRQHLPVLYRVHRQPEAASMEMLVKQFSRLGIKARYRSKHAHRHIGEWLAAIAERPDFPSLQLQVLQTMPPAEYKPRNDGHFSLALDDYAHFTSPIRRYPDLWLHRQMSAMLAGDKVEEMAREQVRQLGPQCTDKEKRADKLSRLAVTWLQCCYLEAFEGKVLAGVIVSIKSYGCFVRLEASGAEGLLPVRMLQGDFYQYDETMPCLRGQRTRREFRLGDAIDVVVSTVDAAKQFVDFALPEA